jgi:hypothetical protein
MKGRFNKFTDAIGGWIDIFDVLEAVVSIGWALVSSLLEAMLGH